MRWGTQGRGGDGGCGGEHKDQPVSVTAGVPGGHEGVVGAWSLRGGLQDGYIHDALESGDVG